MQLADFPTALLTPTTVGFRFLLVSHCWKGTGVRSRVPSRRGSAPTVHCSIHTYRNWHCTIFFFQMDTRENKQYESNTSRRQQERIAEVDNITTNREHLARQGQPQDVNSSFAHCHVFVAAPHDDKHIYWINLCFTANCSSSRGV